VRLIAETMPLALQGHITITLNGEDVTDRCWGADTETGWAGLYQHRDGAPYIDEAGEIATEERYGRIEIALQYTHSRPARDAWLARCATDAAETRLETHFVAQGASV
jgi:hypothetical protein